MALFLLCRDSDGNNQHVRHNPGIPGTRRGGMADQSRGTANFHQVWYRISWYYHKKDKNISLKKWLDFCLL